LIPYQLKACKGKNKNEFYINKEDKESFNTNSFEKNESFLLDLIL
jgi:hypothetical protein